MKLSQNILGTYVFITYKVFLFGSYRRPASSRFWFKCLVSLKFTDYTINNTF